MAIDVTAARSRRSLLAGVLGGTAAAVAATVAGAQRVLSGGEGDNGTPIAVAGLYDDAHDTTRIINNTNNQTAIRGGNNQAGVGVEGFTSTGTGVLGDTGGTNGTAVKGHTSGHHSQIGIDGDTTSGLGEGIGVRGRTINGIGVDAIATGGGYGLRVQGRAVFDRSGRVTMAQGQSSRTVSGVRIDAATVIVATIQGNVPGTWVRGVSVNAVEDTFTIRLNKAAPRQLTVGWFVVN